MEHSLGFLFTTYTLDLQPEPRNTSGCGCRPKKPQQQPKDHKNGNLSKRHFQVAVLIQPSTIVKTAALFSPMPTKAKWEAWTKPLLSGNEVPTLSPFEGCLEETEWSVGTFTVASQSWGHHTPCEISGGLVRSSKAVLPPPSQNGNSGR